LIGASKLNEADVEKIRELLREGFSQAKIAREFIPEGGVKVSRTHINQIANGKKWNPKKQGFIMKYSLDGEILEILEDSVPKYIPIQKEQPLTIKSVLKNIKDCYIKLTHSIF